MRRGVGVPLVVAAFVAASCSGGSDAAPESTGPTTSTTDVPAPATSEPVDTTEVTTTDAPTTTIDPTDELIAEIEADLNAGEQAFLAGAADPSSTNSRQNLERYFAGRALELHLQFYDALASDGLTVRPNSEVPSTVVVTRVVDVISPTKAVVEFCRIDAGVIVDRLPDGNEAIVNDAVIRYDYVVTLERRNDVWLSPGGGETLDEQVGVENCVDG